MNFESFPPRPGSPRFDRDCDPGGGERAWFRYDPECDPRVDPSAEDRYEREANEFERLDDPRAYEGRGEFRVPRRRRSPGYPEWLPDVGGGPHEWDRLPEWQPPPAFESDLREQYRESIGPGFRGIGPRNYRRPDASIHDELAARLTRAHDIDASAIEVRVLNGEVTLSGSVRDRRTKHAVEDIAAEIPGVSHVQNDLRVAHHHGGWINSEPDPKQGWMRGVIG